MASLPRLARAACAVGLAGTALAAVPLAAQPASQRAIPSTYAITNARIVPVSGPVIAKGTVVVRDGLIAAVGATVATPADARVIDGTGLTVYPGLIDAYSSVGLGGAAAPTGGGRGGGGAAAALAALAANAGGGANAQNAANRASTNTLHPPGLQPEVSAAE